MTTFSLTASAVRALEFCEYCPRLCHFACPAAHGDASETATAWGMMSLANMLRKGGLPFGPEDTANLWRCASCQRCTAFCRHGNDVASVIESVRAHVVARDAAPPFVEATRRAYADHGGADTPSEENLALMAQPRVTADLAYFPSCTLAGDDQGRVRRTLKLLETLTGRPVALGWREGTMCCGDSARRSGLPDVASEAETRLRDHLRHYTLVVTDCPDLDLGHRGPERVALLDFLARHLPALRAAAGGEAGPVTLHGGCRERRTTDTVSAEVEILEALGFDVAHAFAIHGEQECCGAERAYRAVSPAGAARAARTVVDGARKRPTPLVTSAPRCADHMSRASGERVRAVIDVVLDSCSIPA